MIRVTVKKWWRRRTVNKTFYNLIGQTVTDGLIDLKQSLQHQLHLIEAKTNEPSILANVLGISPGGLFQKCAQNDTVKLG